MLKKSTSGEIAKSIDAIVFTCNFEKIFESAQLEIWDCLRDSIKDAFKACNSVLNFDYSNIYNLTIRTGKTTIYPFGRRFSIVHEKIKSNCPNIAI